MVDKDWREYYQRLQASSAAPLWEVLATLVPQRPQPSALPAMWRYEEMRPLLMEAGRRITAQEAERRVLILENPGLRGHFRITGSLYAGLQLVMPGETAPSHRHTASATRFILEGTGAYTAVDGERVTMHPGDFILTPSWTYHDHGNPSQEPVVWLDGLDIPIVNMFDTGFAERRTHEAQPTPSQTGAALEDRQDSAALQQAGKRSAPVLAYPYAQTRKELDRLYRSGPVDACHGVKMEYTNPATGGYLLPAIAAFLQLLPSGFRGAAYRSTDATIYCAVEGRGRSLIGGGDEAVTFEWREHDVFVVPSWFPVRHETDDGAVLFSFSDRPAQKVLGLWREQAPVMG
jgi:gentisate 1,2-dioxygenase